MFVSINFKLLSKLLEANSLIFVKHHVKWTNLCIAQLNRKLCGSKNLGNEENEEQKSADDNKTKVTDKGHTPPVILNNSSSVTSGESTEKIQESHKSESIAGSNLNTKSSDPNTSVSERTCGSFGGTALHTAGKRGRHRYEDEIEAAVNSQVSAEFSAGYGYLSMACYFGNMQVALPGVHGFFMNMYNEELGHARSFIDYQLLRGGKVKLEAIAPPCIDNWESVLKALEVSIEMEKLVKDKLVTLHDLGAKYNDVSLMEFVSGSFMKEQDESISELARMITRASKMGCCGCTEYLFDKEIFKNYVKCDKNKCTPVYN